MRSEKEIRQNIAELLHDAIGLLMNHEQHEDDGWIADYEELVKKYSESSSDTNTASGDFWRDAKNDLPAKTGVYATYTYPTQHAGEIYSCELYSRKHGGWCEADHDIDLWCELPDPSKASP